MSARARLCVGQECNELCTYKQKAVKSSVVSEIGLLNIYGSRPVAINRPFSELRSERLPFRRS